MIPANRKVAGIFFIQIVKYSITNFQRSMLIVKKCAFENCVLKIDY